MKHIIDSEALIKDIEKILSGIDATETDSIDGWWETSTGAEFGADILNQLRTLLASSPKADEYIFYIDVEKMLLDVLGREWKPSGFSINSLLAEIKEKLSPKADDENTPPDVYDIAVDTGDGIYHTAEVVHFQQNGSKRMIQVRLGEPQSDDVRKDVWISVEDRLPEINGSFLVYLKKSGVSRKVYRIKTGWTMKKVERVFDDVTHWQPLPAPPLDKARE